MGPNSDGPPRKGGHDEVEYALIKAEVLNLRHQNMTHSEIAAVTGYERSAISRMLKKIYRELADEAGGEETRVREVERLDKMISLLVPVLLPDGVDDEGNPALPSAKAVDQYLKLAKFKAELTGAFAPKQIDHRLKFDDEEMGEAAEKAAEMVQTYMDLVDKVAASGYGSGRNTDIVDAEVVEDATAAELVEGEDGEWSESEEEVGPVPVGQWINGKFVPTPELPRGGDDLPPTSASSFEM